MLYHKPFATGYRLAGTSPKHLVFRPQALGHKVYTTRDYCFREDANNKNTHTQTVAMEYYIQLTIQDQWWNTELDKVLTSIALQCMCVSCVAYGNMYLGARWARPSVYYFKYYIHYTYIMIHP